MDDVAVVYGGSRQSSRIDLTIAKWTVICALIMLASMARVVGNIAPFGAGVYAALVVVLVRKEGKWTAAWIPSIMYIVAEFVASLHPFALVRGGALVLCMSVAGFLSTRGRGKDSSAGENLGIFVIAFAIGQAGLLVYHYFNDIHLIDSLITASLSIIFAYICLVVFKAVIINRLKYKLLEVEVACGAILLCVVALGLSAVSVFDVPIIIIAGLLIILVAGYAGGPAAALVSAAAVGTGVGLADYSAIHIAMFVFVAFVVCLFVRAPRILCSLSAMAAFVMFAFFFDGQSQIADTLIAAAIGGVIFCLIPKSSLIALKDMFVTMHGRIAMRQMVERNRLFMGHTLRETANVFGSLARLMDSGVAFDDESALAGVKKTVMEKVCWGCAKSAVCKMEEREPAVTNLIGIAVGGGRPNVLEIDDFLTQNCTRIVDLINMSEDLAKGYLAAKRVATADREARELSGGQMKGVAAILSELSEGLGSQVCFDLDLERLIMEELTYRDIICSEALITTKPPTAVIIVRAECHTPDNCVAIEKILSRIMRQKMAVVNHGDGLVKGWCALTLEPPTKFDAVFGAAGVPKGGGLNGGGAPSGGDTFTFLKPSSGKFLMALCDGMGTGYKAREISNMAVSLVENFYKAGFSHELTLSQINKFLSVSTEGETFSALDVCAINLESGECDIIKVASPTSYIKSAETTLSIDGNALPLGVLAEIRPSLSTTKLVSGDMIILTSDGIGDVWGDRMAEYINNLDIRAPQVLADKILHDTLKASGGMAGDDMTVVVGRVVEK
ncbi:MAG: serine/threonine-protein phosphatase [Firmicutes bacterium]|nr:serine/threonine-protein phosphatase [Bacillota bacterium]